MADTYIRVMTELPGDREPDEEFMELGEFLDHVRSCSPDEAALRNSLVTGQANVHEMNYRWTPGDVPAERIGQFIAGLPQADRNYRPDFCQTITHRPNRDRLVTTMAEFGITFRKSDVDQPVATRRQLEKPLWDLLHGYSRQFPVEHVNFDLASVTDQFRLELPLVEIVQLLEPLRASRYRSSIELFDTLTVLKPDRLELIYLCGR